MAGMSELIQRYKRRRGKLLRRVGEIAQAMLVTHLPDVRYLCGFKGSNGALVLLRSRAVLFTDGRYTAQAEAEAVGTRVVTAAKPAVLAACEWMEAAGVEQCGFDGTRTTVFELGKMQGALSKQLGARARRAMFVDVGAAAACLREVKDAGEVAVLRRAALVGCALFEHMLGFIEAGMSEMAVAGELEYRARLAGAEAMSFETIVASGERSALPHGRATDHKIARRGFVTLDFGVVLDGYVSDMTRTVHMGGARRSVTVGVPGHREVYDSVLEAQEAAVSAVAPGVTAGEIDEAARSVLRRDGLDQYFTHSTGHGVGLEIHEGPRLAARQTQKLEAGMVITIEPGVYVPGAFGVRIEDMVLVTAVGGEVLTPSTKAWIEL
jgi:Xaa-Pro aminopeptidase